MRASRPAAVVERERVRVEVKEGVRGPAAADWLAREEPLEIRVRGESVAVTMRTPGHDAELAAGFLLSEGLIKSAGDVVEIAHCQSGENAGLGNIINVFLAPGVKLDLGKLSRHVFASSSCGLCGKGSIESVHQHFAPVRSELRVRAEILSELPERVRGAQEAFAQTGGMHGAAVFTVAGELEWVHEDVGRHNAVDKVVGEALLAGKLPLDDRILFVSGRSSFEIMQKALAARIALVAAVGAPSSLAVEFAEESGQTLVGFLRGGTFNIYAHEVRIQ